jgi:hypothetical protein
MAIPLLTTMVSSVVVIRGLILNWKDFLIASVTLLNGKTLVAYLLGKNNIFGGH